MNAEDPVFLTELHDPVQPGSPDNQDYQLIISVGQKLDDGNGNVYVALEMLGTGQFGQVIKVGLEGTQNVYAMKITKSHDFFRLQADQEVNLLKYVCNNIDGDELSHISRIISFFDFKHHLCILFDLLSFDLYKIISFREFRGLPLVIIQPMLRQMLQVLVALKRIGIVHSDIKPENIVLSSVEAVNVILIDFGSARGIDQPCSFYIQSRYYRAPEVVLAIPHSYPIDIWSLACVAVELFLGVPLLPGQSEIHLLELIVEMFGQFPPEIVRASPRNNQLFNSDGTLKTEEEICALLGQQPTEFTPYLLFKSLPEIVMTYEMSLGTTPEEKEKETNRRALFIDLMLQMFALNPEQRITPEDALKHQFITTDFSQ